MIFLSFLKLFLTFYKRSAHFDTQLDTERPALVFELEGSRTSLDFVVLQRPRIPRREVFKYLKLTVVCFTIQKRFSNNFRVNIFLFLDHFNLQASMYTMRFFCQKLSNRISNRHKVSFNYSDLKQ